MHVAASFVTTRERTLKDHWQRHSALGNSGVQGTDRSIGPDVDLGGRLVVFDWKRKTRVFERPYSCPSGFTRLVDQPYTYALASMRSNELYLTDAEFRTTKVISNRLFNDLHSVAASRSGVLVTSTGLDAILAVSTVGEVLWSWFAFEHGLDRDQFGNRRVVDVCSGDHRVRDYPTLFQSTHVNSAIEDPFDSNVVYASLFHQGAIAMIDRPTGEYRLVHRGLKNCHSIRAITCGDEPGYSVANTKGGEVIVFDREFKIRQRIPIRSSWISDAHVIEGNRCLVADAANHRIFECDWQGREYDTFQFDSEFGIYQVEAL